MKKNIDNLNVTRFLAALTLTSSIMLVVLDVNSEKKSLEARAGEIVFEEVVSEPEKLEYTACDIEEIKYENYQRLMDDEIEPVEEIKEYSGMALSHEYEEYISEKAEEYNVPVEAVLCLGNIENGGKWECNGVSSNGNYGQFQINVCNLKMIHNHFGWFETVEETKDALINDDEKNAEAAIWIMSLIIEKSNCKSSKDLSGTYNGGGDWKNIPHSVSYTYAFADNMNKYFPGKLEEVDEKIKNYKKPEPEKKRNTNLENDILALQTNELDNNFVKKLV